MTFALLQNDQIKDKIAENTQLGGVAKRPKATVCKTVIRRFESDRRLLFLMSLLGQEVKLLCTQTLLYRFFHAD